MYFVDLSPCQYYGLMTFEKVIRGFENRALRLKDVQRYLDAGRDVNRRDQKMNWSLLHFAAEDCLHRRPQAI